MRLILALDWLWDRWCGFGRRNSKIGKTACVYYPYLPLIGDFGSIVA